MGWERCIRDRQLFVALQDPAVDEIVAFDAGEGGGVVRIVEPGDVVGAGAQEAGCALPHLSLIHI